MPVAGQLVGLWLVAIVSVLYTGAAVAEVLAGRYPNAVIFAGYVLANVGLAWSMK